MTSITVSNPQEISKHIQIFSQNKIPKNNKGEEYECLEYVIESSDMITSFFDSILLNSRFKGKLKVSSTSNIFSDLIGYKISQIIEKNNLSAIEVNNKDTPFSDKVSMFIGNALRTNTGLSILSLYMRIGELSKSHIFQFILNEKSNLTKISKLLFTQDLISDFLDLKQHLSSSCKLRKIEFFIEPFTELNLHYDNIIKTTTFEEFLDFIQKFEFLEEVRIDKWYEVSDDIEKNSNVLINKNSPYSIPLLVENDYDYTQFIEFNNYLFEDVNKLNTSFAYACLINKEKHKDKTDIHSIYKLENDRMEKIIKGLNLDDTSKTEKNSIVSIRSYLNKTIGELLNRALYELDIQRERHPENSELITANGSIKFIASFLIEEYSKQLQEMDKQIYK